MRDPGQIENQAPHKILAARESLERRFHGGLFPGKQCVVILDLLRYCLAESPIAALMTLQGFRSLRSARISLPDPEGFQGYGRAHWFKREGSDMKFSVESEPRERWLDPYAVTLFADDRTGLLPEEVFAILELLPDPRLTLMELAFDFSFSSGVTKEYVRRRGVFGKSQRDLSLTNPDVDWWGARKGGKRIKSYSKLTIAAHRVEFRMRPKFLHAHGIFDVLDFQKFVDLLPGHHFLFARLDEDKVAAQLRRTRNAPEARHVLEELKRFDGDLTAQMKLLRQAGLKNTRRLLIPLRKNRLVREALREWASKWPTTPAHLGTTR